MFREEKNRLDIVPDKTYSSNRNIKNTSTVAKKKPLKPKKVFEFNFSVVFQISFFVVNEKMVDLPEKEKEKERN